MPDLSILSSLAKNEVLKHLQYFDGDKDLIIEASLMKFLERIVGATFLRNQGVKKIFKLETSLGSDCSQLVYIISPVVTKVKLVIVLYIKHKSIKGFCLLDHIKSDQRQLKTRNYVILYYPARTFVIDYLMEQECLISENILVENLNLHFVPLENNVLSYEQPIYFKDLYIENSTYPLEYITKSLIVLMKLYGLIPLVYSLGDRAHELSEMLKFNVVAGNFDTNDTNLTIGRLIIFDRNLDMVTPCLSQVTYEGMLSDVFTITSGFLTIEDEELLSKLPANSSKILLSDKNLIYSQIRDMYLSNVFMYLKEELNVLHQLQEKSEKISSVSDMKQFVSTDLRVLQSKRSCILTHMLCGEKLMLEKNKENFSDRLYNEYEILKGKSSKVVQEYIENQIIMGEPPDRCLCLIALWCRCSNPSAKNLEAIQNIFYESYGYEYLSTFDAFEKFGIIKAGNSANFEKLSRDLKLIPDEHTKCHYPLDMGSIYNSKYRPLSCRTIESILNPAMLETLKTTSMSQCLKQFQFIPFKTAGREAQDTVLILMLGGINHSEIGCIKTIGINLGIKIIIATTAVTNGTQLMNLFPH